MLCGLTSSDGTDQDQEGQLDGIIPRGNDQHDPVRLGLGVYLVPDVGQPPGLVVRGHPVTQVVKTVGNIVDADTDFHHQSLHLVL